MRMAQMPRRAQTYSHWRGQQPRGARGKLGCRCLWKQAGARACARSFYTRCVCVRLGQGVRTPMAARAFLPQALTRAHRLLFKRLLSRRRSTSSMPWSPHAHPQRTGVDTATSRWPEWQRCFEESARSLPPRMCVSAWAVHIARACARARLSVRVRARARRALRETFPGARGGHSGLVEGHSGDPRLCRRHVDVSRQGQRGR